MRIRRIPIITKKILTCIIGAGFLLCLVVFAAGYWSFSRLFRTHYDASIRSISMAAREVLHPDKFEQYLKTKQPDDDYIFVSKILQDIVDKFDLNLLYVSYTAAPDYTHITYIFNPVKKGGRWKAFPLGYEEDYFEPNYNRTAKLVFENGDIIVRHTIKTRSNSHITAMCPVFDSHGKVVAVIGAQKSIQGFVDSIHSYTRFVFIIEICFAILFFIFFSWYFDISFIKPLVQITHETDHFASWGGEPSDILLTIKNHDEIGTLAHSIHQMEFDVCQNIKELTTVTAEKERISTELNLAAKIQIDSLPQGYPPFPSRTDFDLFASMSPAKEVGGDLYDYAMIDDKHLLVSVGDVSGKGVPAALFMMTAKTLITSYAEQGLSPAQIFSRTNNQLCKGNDSNLFVTCWLGIINLETGELIFVNAGHPRPVIWHKNEETGEKEFIFIDTKPNFVLGGMEGVSFKEHSLTLNKGDRLFIYTDGVTEAENVDHTLFGEDRLMAAIQGTENFPAPKTLIQIRKNIDEFAGQAEQFDDITMLQFVLLDEDNSMNKTEDELNIAADDKNLDNVQDFIRTQINKSGIEVEPKLMMQMELSIEEIYVNICHYAYEESNTERPVSILCKITKKNESEHEIEIVFSDSGVPFDPLKKDDPDISLGSSERQIGGLGIFLTKKCMDSVEYNYLDGKNVLTLRKLIK